MALYRTIPTEIQYVEALQHEGEMIVQPLDRSGKPVGQTVSMHPADFKAEYEPAKRKPAPRKTKTTTK